MKILDILAGEIRKLRGHHTEPLDPVSGTRFEWEVPIVKVDEEKRLVYGVVYEPNVADADGDTMTEAEIEKSAHGFMMRYAVQQGTTGTDHDHQATPDEIVVVESFIAPHEMLLGEQLITRGTWVMAAKVLDEAMWQSVKKGDFTGWSFEGWGIREEAA